MEEPQRPERPREDDPQRRRTAGLAIGTGLVGLVVGGFAFTDPTTGLAARVFVPLFLVCTGLLIGVVERQATAEGGDASAAEHARRLEAVLRGALVVLLGVSVATVFDGSSDGILRILGLPLAAVLLFLARRAVPLLEGKVT